MRVASYDRGVPSREKSERVGHPPKSNGLIDFKNNFKGKANAGMLGQAGNFAYYAIGSGFLPSRELDTGAGLYGLYSAIFGNKHFSDLTGPMFSDTSAASVRDAALASNRCKQ